MGNRHSRFVGLAVLAGAGLTAPGLAQRDRAAITGTVTDTLGTRLEGAEVELLGTKFRILTTASGGFRFDSLRAGRYWLQVRRIGYVPLRTTLTLRAAQSRTFEFQLQTAPVTLPDVVVEAEVDRFRRKYRDFLWRSHVAWGSFLTRDDIARFRPVRLGDLVLRYMPFKASWTMDQAGGFPDLSRSDRDGYRRLGLADRYQPECPPAVSLNGAAPTPGLAVNDFPPEEVEALEVYKTASNVPIEFSFAENSRCGLVVVWLK